jgi:hypothetical protein
MSERLIKLSTLTPTSRIIYDKYFDECLMPNQTIHQPILPTTLTLTTIVFELNSRLNCMIPLPKLVQRCHQDRSN